MRRVLPMPTLPMLTLLGAGLLAQGCVGFDNFIDNTLTTRTNPNRPLGDSINMRRVQGVAATDEPVLAEPGNVWPRGVERMPTLQDLEGGAMPGPAGTPVTPVPRRSSAAPAPEAAPVIAAAPQRDLQPASPAREANASEAPLLPDLARPATGGQRYRTVSTPSGTAVVAPNGDGTNTLMRADGSVTTVPAQR